MAKKKKKQPQPFKYVDSSKSDWLKAILPSNIAQAVSKVFTNDAQMSNASLSDDQKVQLWDVIQNAQKRTGSKKGGTEYSDYGGLGNGDANQFNDWFNKGKIGFFEGIGNTVNNPGFELASTIGRGNYQVDPKDPNVVNYTDVYDWNPGEKYYKNNSAYKVIRNMLRSNEDKDLTVEKNDPYRMNFQLNKQEIDKLRTKVHPMNIIDAAANTHLQTLPFRMSPFENGGWLDKYASTVAKSDATSRPTPGPVFLGSPYDKEIARRQTFVGTQSKTPAAMKKAAEERYAQEKRNEAYKKAAEYAQIIGGGLEVAAPFTGPLAPIVGGAGTLTSAGSSAYLAGRDVSEQNYGSGLMNAGFGALGIAGYTPAARATNIGAVNVAKAADAADYISDVAGTYNAYDNYGRNYSQRVQDIRQHLTDNELQDVLRPRQVLTPYSNQRSNADYNLGASVIGMPIENRSVENNLRDWSTYNELSITGGSNFLQQFREQNGYLKKTLLDKLKDKAGKIIDKADIKLGELVSPAKSLPKNISLEKLSDEINKELAKGVGIKKQNFPLRINLAGDLDRLVANTQIINPNTNELINAGNINLRRQQQPYGSKKFSEVLFPNKKSSINPGHDTWNNTLGFAKVSDFPFMQLPNKSQAMLEKQGISGEYNKAINEVLKRNGLGNILSGGTGHTDKGAARWQNLIQKGLAEDLGDNYYKLKKNGGWLDKYEDGGELNYNDYSVSAPEGFQGDGYSNVGRNYSPAWGGQFAMGGSMPGSVGFMYARTQDPAPSNGKYAKKTKASAENGTEMRYYQEGLDFKPKTISRDGSQLVKLDQLTNFTNYNTKQPGGWLDKYES